MTNAPLVPLRPQQQQQQQQEDTYYRIPAISTPSGKQTSLTANYVTTADGGWEYRSAQDSTPEDKTPTHHDLDPDMLSIYIYPTNLSVREYQLAIVKRALFENVLCALPTGLGKTFIASTVMLNFYRWTKTGKIIFMAPTRPLVSQQLEACLGITGMPRDVASILIGGSFTPALRALEWADKRVFFATPQTVDNDLKKGILDPKDVACLVVDEAHRATGNHAYVEVVRFLNRFNNSFRVLALTATPSTTLEGVQAVITNLNISRVELRTEDSDDIKPYVHKKNIERLVSPFSADQTAVMGLLVAALQPLVDELYRAKVLFVNDAANLSQFVAVNAMKTLMTQTRGGGPPNGAQFKYLAILKVLASMGHALGLLKFHGITPFYNYIESFEQEARYGLTPAGNKKKSAGKYTSQFLNSPEYTQCINKCKELIYKPGGTLLNRRFVGHPKLENLIDLTREFFRTAANDSKAIIFSAYRDSGQEILRVLQEHVPQCRPHLFIGQAAGRASTTESSDGGGGNNKKSGGGGGGGMSQKEQQAVVARFKAHELNTLVATSIGEEGLDIGEVDLIVCYDASSSPIRMLQRIGRTGRKRAGQIYMLLSEREERKLDQSFDNYKYIQNLISGAVGGGNGSGSGGAQELEYAPRHRILPPDCNPECVQMAVDIPEENKELLAHEDIVKEVELTQRASVKGRKNGGGGRAMAKAPKKKFNMPDHVETGFVSAGSLGKTVAGGKKKKLTVIELSDDDDEDDDDDDSWMWNKKGKPRPRKKAPVVASTTLESVGPPTSASVKRAPVASDRDKVLYYDATRDGPDYGLDVPTNTPGASAGSRVKSGQPPRRTSRRFTDLMATISGMDRVDYDKLRDNLDRADVGFDKGGGGEGEGEGEGPVRISSSEDEELQERKAPGRRSRKRSAVVLDE